MLDLVGPGAAVTSSTERRLGEIGTKLAYWNVIVFSLRPYLSAYKLTTPHTSSTGNSRADELGCSGSYGIIISPTTTLVSVLCFLSLSFLLGGGQREKVRREDGKQEIL